MSWLYWENSDLARDLRKELRTYKYDKFAHSIAKQGFGRTFKDYDTCYAVLGAMVKFRCKKDVKTEEDHLFVK